MNETEVKAVLQLEASKVGDTSAVRERILARARTQPQPVDGVRHRLMPALAAVAVLAVVAAAAAIGSWPPEAPTTSEGPHDETVVRINDKQAAETGEHVPWIDFTVTDGDPVLSDTVQGHVLSLKSGQRLDVAGTPGGGIAGWLAPLATTDGKTVVYNDWTWTRAVESAPSYSSQGIEDGDVLAVPSIVSVDLATGVEQTIQNDSYSYVARDDGGYGFVKTDDGSYRANIPMTGALYVAEPGSDAVRWSDGGSVMIAAAWAGNRLLAYQTNGTGGLTLSAWSGPGESQVLGTGSLVAVSPDGAQALLSDTDAQALILVDIASGRELSVLSYEAFDSSDGRVVSGVGYAGDWLGDQVITETNDGFISVKITDGTLVANYVAVVGDSDETHLPLHELRFADKDGTVFTAWQPTETGKNDTFKRTNRAFSCNLVNRECTRGPNVGEGVFNQISTVTGRED